MPIPCISVLSMTGSTSRRGTVFRHNNITRLQLAAIFVGQKKNEHLTYLRKHRLQAYIRFCSLELFYTGCVTSLHITDK